MPVETMTEELVRKIEMLSRRLDELDSRVPPSLYSPFSPTPSNTVNIDALSFTCYYLDVGLVCIVFGGIAIDATTSGLATSFEIDTPTGATFTAGGDAGGIFGRRGGQNHGTISAVAGAPGTLSFQFNPITAANAAHNFIVAYYNKA